MTTDLLDQLVTRIGGLDAAAKEALIREAHEAIGGAPWVPTIGPQADAFYSEADLLLYGGQGGGGSAIGVELRGPADRGGPAAGVTRDVPAEVVPLRSA